MGDHFIQEHPDAGVNFYTNDKEIQDREVRKRVNPLKQLLEKYQRFECRGKIRQAYEKTLSKLKYPWDGTVQNFDNVSCSRANCPELNNKTYNDLHIPTSFKTTVESWSSSTLKVKCPKCSVTDRPRIRRQKIKVATSPVGAFCLNACWPICFMPFLMSKPSTLDIYCRHCGFFMGEYDRATGRLLCRCKTEGKELSGG
ncbi:unnamed protein product [Acanthoscelides obtectus]|uniref:LITAF domain-containing protein n=1 Tax=Acanthoscelides obtectus TaxID=200917 RepID=A0A9P0KXB0_ACAOB|nr:unnamed protein product [Acanthoscelides obtectus]CAK1619832.1 hypothetical protein AOBTE_LOCUS15 [Acanthoscelides obtectus]